MIDKFVGAQVKFYRQKSGKTQKQLADFLGISFQQVQKYETAANRISASKLAAMSTFFDVPVQDFFPTQYGEKR